MAAVVVVKRAGGAAGLFIVDADRNPPPAGQGRINASLRMYLEPKDAFKQIFTEGWRHQRDYLDVSRTRMGSDWPKMKQMYGALLPFVNHRADLNYLLDNMGAELAVGHSYVRGGDMPDVPVPGWPAGGDFAVESGRYRITRIYDNESFWNPDLRAPLAAPGVEVSVGDYVLAINGIELRAPDNIFRLLDGTANRQTVLAVTVTNRYLRARDRSLCFRWRTRTVCERAPGSRTTAEWSTSARRAARLRLPAEYRAARLHEVQPLLLCAARQEGRRHRRALQRRRFGGRLHHQGPRLDFEAISTRGRCRISSRRRPSVSRVRKR